jgi:hypothetical protein
MYKEPLEDLKDFIESDLPENLYHYTNLNGLQGILSNSEIWLSNLYFLNDKSEYELGLKIVVEQLENYKSGFSVLRSTKYFVESLEKAIEFIKEKESPYILSLTSNNDLLSQWRGYTENGVGVNIGFGKEFFQNNSLNIFKCIYDKEKQVKFISHIVTESIFMFVGVAHSQGIFEEEKETDLEDYNESVSIAGRYFIDRIILACSLIKDSNFKEEDEWRVLYFGNDKEVNFLNKGNYFKPYIKYDLKDLDESISEIFIGPNSEKELCFLSIELLLKKYSISSDKIKFSEIPYRN